MKFAVLLAVGILMSGAAHSLSAGEKVGSVGKLTLASFPLDLPAKSVLDLLGQPTRKSRPLFSEMTALWERRWIYKDLGVVLHMTSNRKLGSGTLESITLSGKSLVATDKGIRVGSAQAQVEAAYGPVKTGGRSVVVENETSLLVIKIRNAKVVAIYYGVPVEG